MRVFLNMINEQKNDSVCLRNCITRHAEGGGDCGNIGGEEDAISNSVLSRAGWERK